MSGEFIFVFIIVNYMILYLETVKIGNRRRDFTRYLLRCAEIAARDTDTSSLKSVLKLVQHC